MTDRNDIAMTDQDDIAGLWDTVVKNFRDTTGVDLSDESIRRFSTADDDLKETVENESKFKKWRHSNQKIPKFSSVLKECHENIGKRCLHEWYFEKQWDAYAATPGTALRYM
ncbi:hypothetical protein EJ06DRAFT_350751 [Trichodelitschia bisporula]|uniref:Fungal STAND N-terminal Goodbye domain-containing protein n=1 Tax=Trichodelitschia bisporula TaxID=703511 RepID=A0A6G1HZV7_9PEZI|nr:hypothetical protein EJ06DRAFT_350751 [Trichodelitschia bisporula]